MIIKEREYKTCPECGSKELVEEAVFGCDNCEKPIDFNKSEKEREYLHITVFYHEKEGTDSLHLCSWKCVFQKLRTLKTDSFIDLPYLSFDMANREMRVEGFWEALAGWTEK